MKRISDVIYEGLRVKSWVLIKDRTRGVKYQIKQMTKPELSKAQLYSNGNLSYSIISKDTAKFLLEHDFNECTEEGCEHPDCRRFLDELQGVGIEDFINGRYE